MDDVTAATVSSIEVVTRKVPGGEEAEVEHVAKIKTWDKQTALVNIGRHLGMFTDKIEHSGAIDLAERLRKAQERLGGLDASAG